MANKTSIWQKLEDAILYILKNELVEKLVIKLIGKSAGIQFYLANLVGKYIVEKWGEPMIEYLLKEVQGQTIKVDAKVKIVRAENAKAAGDKDSYFDHIGSI